MGHWLVSGWVGGWMDETVLSVVFVGEASGAFDDLEEEVGRGVGGWVEKGKAV